MEPNHYSQAQKVMYRTAPYFFFRRYRSERKRARVKSIQVNKAGKINANITQNEMAMEKIALI